MRNYVVQNEVTLIEIIKLVDTTNLNLICHARITTKNSGVKLVLLGNVDHFLENLEKVQIERVTSHSFSLKTSFYLLAL